MTRAVLRGITLRHPWVWAFLHGKDVENRKWHPSRMGGQVGMYLALHGGALPRKSDDEYLDEIAHALEWMQDLGLIPGVELPDFGHYYQPQIMRGVSPEPTVENTRPFCPTGIVAVARLAEVTQNDPSKWAAEGQYHWRMADLLTLPVPIPHRGAQGLWQLQPEALDQVRAAWKARTAA
ncbi:hypothetical protein K7W42_18065 [Deinococcus sp. HMF7604]|uniref:hypothetical protein n=1 Tax=Deinococcus betulae TaxID=2873312 RepID=UPI001CC98195|nr:hypothetical protein [Deinococcus betulae]MBZ9752750.1 hypothetical protein [Deinococcus betulae]